MARETDLLRLIQAADVGEIPDGWATPDDASAKTTNTSGVSAVEYHHAETNEVVFVMVNDNPVPVDVLDGAGVPFGFSQDIATDSVDLAQVPSCVESVRCVAAELKKWMPSVSMFVLRQLVGRLSCHTRWRIECHTPQTCHMTCNPPHTTA